MADRRELRRPRFKVLIAIDDPDQRARLCGYPPDWDCLHDLTLDHLRRFADSGWLRKWGTDPGLREHTQASITIYGTWGFPRQVHKYLTERAKRAGLVMPPHFPSLPEDDLQLFIIGACRNPSEE